MTAVRVRQVVVAVRDLAARAADATAAGLPFVYQDPDVGVFGAANSLHAASDTFVELLAEKDPGSAVGRHLERLGGDGGYMVIIQVDDLDHHLGLVETAQIRTVFEAEVDGIRGVHLHPADVGGAIVSLDQADPAESWPWCGPAWTAGAPPTAGHPIDAITMSATDPEATAARWAAILDVDAHQASLVLEATAIDFIEADGRPDRLVAVTVQGMEDCELGGVHFSARRAR